MRISNCDNVVRSMKTLEVVVKMAFLVFEKRKISPQCSVKWQQKLNFEINSKVRPTKQDIVFEKLNQISSLTWTATENTHFRGFVTSLPRKKVELINFYSSFLFANWAENMKYYKIEAVLSFEKRNEKWTSNCHSKSVKILAVQGWFYLKISYFSALQSWIRAV